MELIRTRASDSVYDSTSGFPVFGPIIARQDGKLLSGVHTQVPAQYASRSAVRVVINADAVQAVIVLLGASPRNADLSSEAAGPPVGTCVEGGLGLDSSHTRLESGQVGPGAAVQRQLANCRRVHLGTDA